MDCLMKGAALLKMHAWASPPCMAKSTMQMFTHSELRVGNAEHNVLGMMEMPQDSRCLHTLGFGSIGD